MSLEYHIARHHPFAVYTTYLVYMWHGFLGPIATTSARALSESTADAVEKTPSVGLL